MSKYRLRSVNDNWGGVLNLTLGNTMSEEECLEIIKKLDDISQNKFYNINVWDTVSNNYFGDIELFAIDSDEYLLINTSINNNSRIVTYTYHFYKDGRYKRDYKYHVQISDIISRLNTIEQKLNEITTND